LLLRLLDEALLLVSREALDYSLARFYPLDTQSPSRFFRNIAGLVISEMMLAPGLDRR
jgi:hypothetical protein